MTNLTTRITNVKQITRVTVKVNFAEPAGPSEKGYALVAALRHAEQEHPNGTVESVIGIEHDAGAWWITLEITEETK